jgi:hypothetical protein
VGAEADLSQAKPLFYSRNSTKLEDFLYVPDSVIVSLATFANRVIPAFQAASARQGAALKSPPVQEVDVLVDRSRLHSDPSAALDQTKAIAQSVKRIARGQDYLIDNVSNTLKVASDDAALGRRMFLFLGLPGVLLAALHASSEGKGLVCPAAQGAEAAWAGSIDVIAAPDLIGLLNHLKGNQLIGPPQPGEAAEPVAGPDLRPIELLRFERRIRQCEIIAQAEAAIELVQAGGTETVVSRRAQIQIVRQILPHAATGGEDGAAA